MKPGGPTEQHGMYPRLLIFGPQGHPSSGDLTELRSYLTANARLSKLIASLRNLHEFWNKLVRFDPELACLPAESIVRGLAEWVEPGHADFHSFQDRLHELPATLAFSVNFLVQIVQYHGYILHSTDGDNAQQAMLKRLQDGGVQGFCLGFLSAVTVASSGSEEELIDASIRALKLAVCIGAYVDKDAVTHTVERATCVSVRGGQTLNDNHEKVVDILRDFNRVCKNP